MEAAFLCLQSGNAGETFCGVAFQNRDALSALGKRSLFLIVIQGGAKIRPPVIASVDGPTIFFLKGSMKYMALV